MKPGITPYAAMIPVKGAVITLIMLLLSCVTSAQEDTKNRAEQLYKVVCTQCHGLTPIETTRDGRAGWEDTVHDMVVTGAQLNAGEMELVIDYLAGRFGPGAGAMPTGLLPPQSPVQKDGTVTSGDVELPIGEGKELVQNYCQMCHDLGRIVSARRNTEDWESYARNMPAQGDLALLPEQIQKLESYLTRHFGR
jgi:mono/diheme cytochrome c family protein